MIQLPPFASLILSLAAIAVGIFLTWLFSSCTIDSSRRGDYPAAATFIYFLFFLFSIFLAIFKTTLTPLYISIGILITLIIVFLLLGLILFIKEHELKNALFAITLILFILSAILVSLNIAANLIISTWILSVALFLSALTIHTTFQSIKTKNPVDLSLCIISYLVIAGAIAMALGI